MNNKAKTNEKREVLALTDELLEDLFAASDEEILEDADSLGWTEHALHQNMDSNLRAAEERIAEERRNAAKAKLEARRRQPRRANVITPDEARRIVARVLQEEDLSIAARNETSADLTDEEVLRKYQDLVDLGLIDPEGA